MGLVQTVLGTFGSKRLSSYAFFVEKVNWNSKIVIQMVLFGKTWILKMMKNTREKFSLLCPTILDMGMLFLGLAFVLYVLRLPA